MKDLEAEYPQLPDDQNGAVAILAIWERDEPGFWNAFKLGQEPLPERREPSWDPDLPIIGSAARAMSRSTDWSESNLVAAESFVAANEERFKEMRAAIRMPAFRFPVKITDGFQARLPHVSAVRKEAERFRIKADLASEQGRIGEALEAIEDIILTGHTLKTEPLQISQLVRTTIYGHALSATERLLCRATLTDAQLNTLEQHLNGIQSTNMLKRMLMSERVASLSVFDMTPEQLAMAIGTEGGEQAAMRWAVRAMAVSGLQQGDRFMMFDTMEKALRLAETNTAASLEQMETLFEMSAHNARKFPPKLFSGLFLPSLRALPDRVGSFEARRRVALTGVAVERFRVRHGRMAVSLQELELESIPLDPFDDKPLRYLSFSNGFIVYSIGPNRADDGGMERIPPKVTSKAYDETFVVIRDPDHAIPLAQGQSANPAFSK